MELKKIFIYIVFFGILISLFRLGIRDDHQTDSLKPQQPQKQISNKNNHKEKENLAKYDYRETFRDPFFIAQSKIKNNKESTNEQKSYIIEDNQMAKLKIKLPFSLMGIIGGSNKKMAIIKIENKTEIIDKSYQYNYIKVLDILTEKVIIQYKKIKLEVKPGSDIGVS
jgi:hypothetical protein